MRTSGTEGTLVTVGMSAIAEIPALVVMTPAIVPATGNIEGIVFAKSTKNYQNGEFHLKKDNKEYNCPFKSYQFFCLSEHQKSDD